MLLALTSGQKAGLGLVGAAFIVFALVSAFLIPALRPNYPGRRGLPAFLTLSVALFLGMMLAVFFFARESEEGRAEAGSAETRTEATTTAEEETTAPETTAPATTDEEPQPPPPPPPAPAEPTNVSVTETEFKIDLASTDLSPGTYKFDLANEGQTEHDLVIEGPGVNDARTPVIDAGRTASVTVKLQRGTYKLYCSVPGHEQAGMKLDVTVG